MGDGMMIAMGAMFAGVAGMSLLALFFVLDATFWMESRIRRRLAREREERTAESVRKFYETSEAVRRRIEAEGIDVGYE